MNAVDGNRIFGLLPAALAPVAILCAAALAADSSSIPEREPSRAEAPPQAASGPLRVCRENPRYFADPAGRAVLLAGSHTWGNLADMGKTDPPPAFDFDAYLDFLVRHHHNFFRLWTWELPRNSAGERLDLARAKPAGELTSTGYCLAQPGRRYLVYLPKGGTASVDLSAAPGRFSVEWYNPKTGESRTAPPVKGGAGRGFKAPFEGHAVLFIAALARRDS